MITVIIEYIFIFLSKKQLIKNASFGVVIVSGERPFADNFAFKIYFKSFRLSLRTASKQPYNWNESCCIELIVIHKVSPLLISVIECGSCIRLT
ncbi:hypothetical protein DFO52_1123 [Enterobacter sp. AG326]|nr:hypothetical protein DFO52_1123 [Enterobacter sp. AG326]